VEREKFKIAEARKKPHGVDTVILPLDMLDPIDKVQEPAFYEFVRKSIKNHGLYHPLVIHPITVEDWKKEMELNKGILTPPPRSVNLRYRIQCGNNRYYALQQMGYDAVECAVIDNLKDARDLCWRLRCDKRWTRGSNWEQMHGRG